MQMRFEIIKKGEGKYAAIILRDNINKCEAEIFCFGGLLNSFSFLRNDDYINIIDGFTSPQDAETCITIGFKSSKLSPFVCRLSKGKYVFDGAEYLTNKFFLGDEAIHGLIYDAAFTIKHTHADDTQASVVLVFDYNNKVGGFPFEYNIEITYALKGNNTLSLETIVTNNGNKAMPLNDGWHPYFKIGNTVNDLLFKMNASKMIEFNDKLIPTGKIVDYNNFSDAKKIGETFLDNCFVLHSNNLPCCTLTNQQLGVQLIINADESYPYLQVYTPPHRKSIAIENLSSPPDSFNNKIDLIILNPDESKKFKTTYTIQFTA